MESENAIRKDFLREVEKGEDREEYKIAITAIGMSFGSLAISSKEKAKTILRHGKPVDPEREYDHILKRLGAKSSSLPELGETPISLAAMAVIKAVIFNPGISLDEITEADFATESARELSKNRMLEIIKYVNAASDVLAKQGINIGHINERASGDLDIKAVHTNQHQSACDSAGQEIYEDAKDGMNPKSVKLLIASDYGSYRKRKPEDETGGAGAIAVIIKPAANAKGGLFISSKLLGEANIDSIEFLKKVVYDIGEGLSIINTDPIVLGNHSNYSYHYLAYNALKAIFKQMENPPSSIEGIAMYDHAMHVPYANMPIDSIAYFLRHLARNDLYLSESIRSQLKIEEPFLENFTNLESEFEFLHDIGEAYLPFTIIKEELDRLENADFSENTRKEIASKYANAVEKALPQQAGLSAEAMRKVLQKYGDMIGGKTKDAIASAISGLEALSKSNAPVKLSEVDMIIAPLNNLISAFEKEDMAYNASMKSTEEFKKLAEGIHIAEATEFSKEIGNIDTGSALLGIASSIYNANNDKPMLIDFYGSTSSNIWLKAKKVNIEQLRHAIGANWRYEMDRRRFISAEEYLELERSRKAMPIANPNLPISSSGLFMSINEEALLRSVKDMMVYSLLLNGSKSAEGRKEAVEAVREKSKSAH
ncbi:MAG: hypothetical protein ACP5NE_03055 [Candidatus Micrarchaeia archaeon]